MTIWTVGHSTRSIDEFIELLKAYNIGIVVDIRTIPRSRKNPQFNKDELARVLPEHGIEYIHGKDLGGLRSVRKDSPNTGWRNDGFRGFADYMQTEQFHDALNQLIEIGSKKRTAIMCAEMLPWRCHRSLIADALIARGIEVVEIFDKEKSRPHKMTPFAVVEGQHILYPEIRREMTIQVCEEEELYRRAADLFTEIAWSTVREKGMFAVALAGGNTPRPVYSMLSEELPWDRTHMFFSDERCVPPDHPESNFRMANETLLSRVDIPKDNIHRMKGEVDPESAAGEYEDEIRRVLGDNPFDLILLGMGEDGHTASLFPDSEALLSTKLVEAVWVSKLNVYRLTLTPRAICAARQIIVLVVGESKAEALKQVIEGDFDPRTYPAQILRSAQTMWLLDPCERGNLVDSLETGRTCCAPSCRFLR